MARPGAHVPPPSKIPSSAVEMPGENPATLNLQFGGADFHFGGPGRVTGADSSSTYSIGTEDTGLRSQVLSFDNYQVLVSNLPYNCSEEALGELFGKYGKVINVSINLKSGGHQWAFEPKSGFIVFDSEEAVENVLADKNIMLYGSYRLKTEKAVEKAKVPWEPSWYQDRRQDNSNQGSQEYIGAASAWSIPSQSKPPMGQGVEPNMTVLGHYQGLTIQEMIHLQQHQEHFSPVLKTEKVTKVGITLATEEMRHRDIVEISKKIEQMKLESEDNLKVRDELIGTKGAEMQKLLVSMQQIEDDSHSKEKMLLILDAQVEDHNKKIQEHHKQIEGLLQTRQELRENCVSNTEDLNNIKRMKQNLENHIDTESNKYKNKEAELKHKMKLLNQVLSGNGQMSQGSGEASTSSSNSRMVQFLSKSIMEKAADLECPVCLEEAAAPIYSCPKVHLICSSCRPRVLLCPECRLEYGRTMEVHRFAEKNAEELVKLRQELEAITGSPIS